MSKVHCVGAYHREPNRLPMPLTPVHDWVSEDKQNALGVYYCWRKSSMPILGYMSTNEWLILLLIVLVLFGASRLPALARSIGEALTEFRRAARTEDEAEQAQK
jgi:sec-independent protein translocase protein TatA